MRIGGLTAIGWRARDALDRAGGVTSVLAALTDSVYLSAGDELVWLGPRGSTLHGRAILCADPLAGIPQAGARPRGAAVTIEAAGVATWCPPSPPTTPRAAATLRDGARALVREAPAIGRAQGFAAAWSSRALPFPLAGAAAAASALETACARDDAGAAARAAIALLGAGTGLTPSGDDFVGGALFARAVLVTAHAADAVPWRRAGAIVSAAARTRTHPISATLLSDHIEGHGAAPLHELAGALADGAGAAALDAARRLTALGHTSGWDVLSGFVAGLGIRT